MELFNGKDPFDPKGYEEPEPNIDGMIRLRAFCAWFFQEKIRSSTKKPDNDDMVSFLVLIRHSPSYFERARAVIPEFQAPDPESSNPNPNVLIFLRATCGMRGPPGKKWDLLPEETKWNELAAQGSEMEQMEKAKDFVVSRNLHQKQLSDLDPTNIPTFVPRNPHDTPVLSGNLVWSPTSGTRPSRPDENFPQSTETRPATPLQFGQGLRPNPNSSYSSMSQYRFHGSRDFSDSPPMGHGRSDSIRRSPPPQFKSTQSPLNTSAFRPRRSIENPNSRHRRHNRSEEMSFPHNLNSMMERTTLGHVAHSGDSSLSHLDNTTYPVANPSGTDSPSQVGETQYPSRQVRELFGVEPFSAPPSIPGYGNLHQTGQGMHGEPPSPFQSHPPHSLARSSSPLQDQRPHRKSGPTAGLPHVFTIELPHAPNSEPWNSAPSRPHHGGSQNQPPNQIIQPVPQRTAQSQIPPFVTQAPQGSSNDAFVVPMQGSMLPFDYWNLLYERENDFRTGLEHANRPMTAQEQIYINTLGDARVNAEALNLPSRRKTRKGKWLAELNRALRNVWKAGPEGEPGFLTPVVLARKRDTAKAIEREIALVEREGQVIGAKKDHR